MPKVAKQESNMKCGWVEKGSEPGCYCLHRPSECRLKFPPNNRPIHKCEHQKKTKIHVPQGTGVRTMLLPSRDVNYYPAIMPKEAYNRLQQQARIVTDAERIEMMQALEAQAQAEARESEERKRRLKEALKPQPGAALAAGGEDKELEGPDRAAHTLARAEVLKDEDTPGPRLANRVILASKCHAIRDAQLVEREMMKKELTEEERRLDSIMEENRQAAIKRAEAEEHHRKQLRLTNLEALKRQIRAHEAAKIMEAERIQEESVRINQSNIAMQIDEANKMSDKHRKQAELKHILDQCNAEILYFKQMQNEEERITDMRIREFLQAKREREARNKAAADAIKAAKAKGIEHISKAQKAEQELKEELERIRNLKIQEDVEREYRRKERDAAIKKHKEMQALHESRTQQINDIHRLIAREIAKDEQSFNNVAKQNEEFMQREKEIKDKRAREVEKHRREIMKQINDKEKFRAESRAAALAEGTALRLERAQAEARERRVVRDKIQAMREQKIPEPYVKEVEQTLAKHRVFT